MAGIKLFLFVKCLTIYNTIVEYLNNVKYNIIDFYEYIRSYFEGQHDIWIFIPQHSLPLPMNYLNNVNNSIWNYDNNTCLLDFNNTSEKTTVKFSWLSTKLQVKYKDTSITDEHWFYEHEYEIDKFIENLRIKTNKDFVPTLEMIFLIWCIYHKHWFPGDASVNFIVITSDGDEITLNTKTDINCLEIKHGKIYNRSDNEINLIR